MDEEVVVRREDAVREPVISHELPDVLEWVEFWAFGWERDEGDVRWHNEAVGQMPSGLVEDEHSVGAWRHLGGDLGEMQVHRFVLQAGMTRAAPLPSFGQIAPKM